MADKFVTIGSVSLIRAAALQLISLPLVLALIALRCVDGLAAIGASRYLRDAVLVRWRPAPLVRFAAEIDDLVLPSPAPVLLCGSLVLSVSYGVCRPLSGVIVCAPFASSRRTLQARLFHCSVTASELFRFLLTAPAVSGGDHRFVIPESAAKQATYFKDALGDWQEGSERVLRLSDYSCASALVFALIAPSADIVELVCRYLVWRERYAQAPAGTDIPEFADQVPTESALLLLMCADYLGC